MTDQPEPAASSQAVSPGARLRAARERMGLDIGAVAGSLHLDRHIVVALEEDRREALPAQAYVRGYVRAYARLVGVDADQLAAMADAAAIDSSVADGCVAAAPQAYVLRSGATPFGLGLRRHRCSGAGSDRCCAMDGGAVVGLVAALAKQRGSGNRACGHAEHASDGRISYVGPRARAECVSEPRRP